MNRLLLFIYVICNGCVFADIFEEELLLKELGSGYIAFHFNFVTRQPHHESGYHHFHIFPKALHQTISKYQVDEFKLSLTQGFWNTESWGSPFVPSLNGGAEVMAWFSPKTKSVDKSWSYFVEALSGQFCASLRNLGSLKNSFSTLWNFQPLGLSDPHSAMKNENFRYAQLPHEEPCTENLTPWTKLLPCKQWMGLASLLKPSSIFRATYNSLNIQYRRVCNAPDCQYLSAELRQSLTVVVDRRYLFHSLTDPWSLAGIFGKRFKKVCPVASRSQVILLKSMAKLSLSPSPPILDSFWDQNQVRAVFDSKRAVNSLVITSLEDLVITKRNPVSIMKYATGKGDIEGGVHIILTNRLLTPLRLALLDSAPWYAEIYFSSLKTSFTSENISVAEPFYADRVTFLPSVQRERMSVLEMLLTLPPVSRVTIVYTFKKILMRWNEYPPDANHGVYLPAASIIYQLLPAEQSAVSSPPFWELSLPTWASTYAEFLSSNHSGVYSREGRLERVGAGLARMYSETPLVRLPVPDFSMPFNALCLVCSVVAVLFGSLQKASTNAMQPVVSLDGGEVDKAPLVRLLGAIHQRFSMLISKVKAKRD